MQQPSGSANAAKCAHNHVRRGNSVAHIASFCLKKQPVTSVLNGNGRPSKNICAQCLTPGAGCCEMCITGAANAPGNNNREETQ
jgi:hypothetical protein